MKIYTKEWHELFDFIGTTELFEPILDKEYSDKEIEELYQDMLDKHVQEEQLEYDEPPFFDPEEWKAEFPEDEFDPEDYLIADTDEAGEESDLRHPKSYEELVEYQKKEFLRELEDFEKREPFDREEAAEFFEEDYRDALEEPDTDIPKWIRDSVDPRLVAMGLLPESVYKKLRAEEAEKQARFDELDKAADKLLAESEENFPEKYEYIRDIMDEIQAEYITSAGVEGGDYVMTLSCWDADDEDEEEWSETEKTVRFSGASMIENEEPVIHVTEDEDGDTESDCDLTDYELYCDKAEDAVEVHMLFDNEAEGLKYVTLRCRDVSIG